MRVVSDKRQGPNILAGGSHSADEWMPGVTPEIINF